MYNVLKETFASQDSEDEEMEYSSSNETDHSESEEV